MFSKSPFTVLLLGALIGCSTEPAGKQPIRYRTLDPQDRVGTAIEVRPNPLPQVRPSTVEPKTQTVTTRALANPAKPVVEPKPPVVTGSAPDSVAKSKPSTEKVLAPVTSGGSVAEPKSLTSKKEVSKPKPPVGAVVTPQPQPGTRKSSPVQTTSPSTNTRPPVDKGAKVSSPEDEFFGK